VNAPPASHNKQTQLVLFNTTSSGEELFDAVFCLHSAPAACGAAMS
jgi:hypothetical protein